MQVRRKFLQTAGLAGFLPSLGKNVAAGTTPQVTTPSLPFRLGMVTYNIPNSWDLKTILQVCGKTGVAAVEFRTTHKHGVEPSLPPEKRKEVKKQCQDAGIVIWGLGSVCEFHSPKPEVVRAQMDECKRFVELAADLGATGVKVRPNGLPKEKPVSDTLKQIGESLGTCAEFAQTHKVEIWCEVHGSGTAEPHHMAQIMSYAKPANAGVTWNSNAQDVKNGSVAASFALLKPWIKSCHINDLYKNQTKEYPYRELFGLLRQAGYDRYTMIEVGRSIPDIAVATEFLKYYRALWQELAQG